MILDAGSYIVLGMVGMHLLRRLQIADESYSGGAKAFLEFIHQIVGRYLQIGVAGPHYFPAQFIHCFRSNVARTPFQRMGKLFESRILPFEQC